MDELQISGKRFISARRIARENGYTSDYIGQLIRGGKIVGQKVGRAWYVDSASFDAYLGSENAPAVAQTVVEATPEPAMPPAAEVAPTPAPIFEPVVTPVAEEVMHAVEVVAPEIRITPEPAVAAQIVQVVPAATIAEDISEPSVVEETDEQPQYVPLRINKEETPASKETIKGLRYYADDAPALPEISAHTKESRIVGRATADNAAVENNGAVTTVRPARLSPVMVGSLAVLGIAIFVFSALVSSAVSLNLSLSEGNTASASYSISW